MSTRKTVRRGECPTTNKHRHTPVSITGSAPYKKMKSSLEKKLHSAQRQIQDLKKQLQNTNKKQRVLIQRANKKERLLKSGFAKKQRSFQQNFKKRVKLMEQKWQHQLDNKINNVKHVAFKQGVQEGERCVRQISKKYSSAFKLPKSMKHPEGKKTHARRKVRSTRCKQRSNKRVA